MKINSQKNLVTLMIRRKSKRKSLVIFLSQFYQIKKFKTITKLDRNTPLNHGEQEEPWLVSQELEDLNRLLSVMIKRNKKNLVTFLTQLKQIKKLKTIHLQTSRTQIHKCLFKTLILPLHHIKWIQQHSRVLARL